LLSRFSNYFPHSTIYLEIVSITSDSKFEAIKTQIVDTESQMNTRMERGYNELRRLVLILTFRETQFFMRNNDFLFGIVFILNIQGDETY